jgi:4-hydroxy 2-oxovalerate aldolase
MYFSKWVNDIDFFNQALKKLTNKIDTLAIVDSYGSIFPEQTRNFLKSINRTKLKLGCHFHNNCGLALANTLAAISEGCSIADATFKGMGRGAGNAETELMLAISYRKKNKISGFDINSLLEKFEKMKIDMKWGTSYAYAYAAIEGYSQSHMMDLIQKRRLDPSAAVKVISSAENHVKEIGFENLKIWKNIIKNKEIPTLIGGAPSLLDYGKILFQKIGVKLPLILSGSNALFNFYKLNLKIKNPIILILSGSEIKKINSYKERNILKKINIKIIVAEKNFLIEKINFKNKNIIFSNSLAINPLLLAGLVLNKLKIKKMNIAFFDGETSTLKGRTMMKETLESVKILQNKKIKIFKLTQSFLPVQFINPWIND